MHVLKVVLNYLWIAKFLKPIYTVFMKIGYFTLFFLLSLSLHQVPVLSRACSDFLIGTMDLCNCLSLLSIAEAYGSNSLLQNANTFVVQNFNDLSETQDYLDMQVLVEDTQGCLHEENN